MEYDELIEKIKDALKITKLEIYERRIYELFSKRLGVMVMKRGLRKAKKTQKEVSIIELKRLTNGFRYDIIDL